MGTIERSRRIVWSGHAERVERFTPTTVAQTGYYECLVTWTLTLFSIATGTAHIVAEYMSMRRAVYFLKPATTSLIILLALSLSAGAGPFYKAMIVLGLLLSLAGDILLMLPADRFVAGLASFLVAHLFYMFGFASRTGFQFGLIGLVPLLLYGAWMTHRLWPHLGTMRLPVLVYMLVILVMAWQALAQWWLERGTGSLLAAAGAVLFVISDSVLALNRFQRPFHSAQAIILATYYLAQLLIAWSIAA